MNRRLPAFVALVCLLLTQLTLAAYACPVVAEAPPAMAMGDCAGHAMPVSADTMCELRCEVGVSLPGPITRDIPILAPAALTVVAQLPQFRRYESLSCRSLLETMATAPPVAIRYCRLLI